jgi:hypothetical protein
MTNKKTLTRRTRTSRAARVGDVVAQPESAGWFQGFNNLVGAPGVKAVGGEGPCQAENVRNYLSL